jgi:hypothetical protein
MLSGTVLRRLTILEASRPIENAIRIAQKRQGREEGNFRQRKQARESGSLSEVNGKLAVIFSLHMWPPPNVQSLFAGVVRRIRKGSRPELERGKAMAFCQTEP